MIILDNKPIQFINFPSGESHLRIDLSSLNNIYKPQVELIFESNSDLVNLALLDNLLFGKGITYELFVPYFPSSRQDRCDPGFLESDSLKVYADQINQLKSCNLVVIHDPHSSATQRYITKKLKVLELFELPVMNLIEDVLSGFYTDNLIIVVPDKGAVDRATKVMTHFRNRLPDVTVKLLQADKTRDYETGEINGIKLLNHPDWTPTTRFLVVDDICDGGRTFIELIKQIHIAYPLATTDLVVTHGFFTKGLDVLYDAGYDHILFQNDFRKLT